MTVEDDAARYYLLCLNTVQVIFIVVAVQRRRGPKEPAGLKSLPSNPLEKVTENCRLPKKDNRRPTGDLIQHLPLETGTAQIVRSELRQL